MINLERAYLVRERIRRRDDQLTGKVLEGTLTDWWLEGRTFEIESMLAILCKRVRELETGTHKAKKLRKISSGCLIEDLKRKGLK